MSKIDYTWHASTPPAPDVYQTRRNQSKYITRRYWDGKTWHELALASSRGGKPFTWPKKSRTRQQTWDGKHPNWVLRKISDHMQKDIQWGCPFRVYDDKEVLVHLVSIGTLPADWRTAYQEQIRSRDYRKIRT